MDTRAEQFKMIGGNLALTQVSNIAFLTSLSEKWFLVRCNSNKPRAYLMGLTAIFRRLSLLLPKYYYILPKYHFILCVIIS